MLCWKWPVSWSIGARYQVITAVIAAPRTTSPPVTRASLTASHRIRGTVWLQASRQVPYSSSLAISGAPMRTPSSPGAGQPLGGPCPAERGRVGAAQRGGGPVAVGGGDGEPGKPRVGGGGGQGEKRGRGEPVSARPGYLHPPAGEHDQPVAQPLQLG